jgi:hypothetical protein
MAVATGKFDSNIIYIYIYIYIPRKKKLTKKLGLFYNTHSFNFVSLVPTQLLSSNMM